MRVFTYLIIFILFFSCASDSTSDVIENSNSADQVDNGEDQGNDTGDQGGDEGITIVFTKLPGSNPSSEANQDRITDNVWITRGNNGGQIYNAKIESSADKNNSPDGTKWAIGTLENKDALTFTPFRTAVGKPQNVVGKNLVLYLEDDDLYLSVKFKSWSSGKAGGFSYERSEVSN
ncbi:MAG: hypothetical protein ACPHXR_01610 [Flavicella sp.]